MLRLIFFLLGFTLIGAGNCAPAPLSCEVQMLLNGLAAMQRDQGVSRTQNRLSTNKDTDLTPRETKEILDRVYVSKKDRTPDEIKNEVYERCTEKRTVPQREVRVKDPSHCTALAEMAGTMARIRDAGTPKAAVEARLRREVSDPAELLQAITVLGLVYRTEGTADQIVAVTRKKCGT